MGRSHKTILFFDQTEKLIKPVSVASTSTSGENLQQIRSTSVSAHIPDVPPVQVVSIHSVVNTGTDHYRKNWCDCVGSLVGV